MEKVYPDVQINGKINGKVKIEMGSELRQYFPSGNPKTIQ